MPSAKRFTRTKEDFACARCGEAVIGTGYTNHCPTCLWSRHVDINPGDRAEECRGMMEPVGLLITGRKQRIKYRCTLCGIERTFDTSRNDSPPALIELSKRRFN